MNGTVIYLVIYRDEDNCISVRPFTTIDLAKKFILTAYSKFIYGIHQNSSSLTLESNVYDPERGEAIIRYTDKSNKEKRCYSKWNIAASLMDAE